MPSPSAAPQSRSARRAEAEPTQPSAPGKPPRALKPGLYPVAVPIGNLGDITLRAIETLGAVDLILAEDTRSAQRLLGHLGIGRPLERYDDHIAEKMRPRVLAALAEGRRVALVSEAGTPLLSDPGYKLVRDVLAAGHAVYPVPGPSALLAALVKSGMPTDRFLFAGFPPPRPAQRRRALEEIAGLGATLVFYESPRRLAGCLADMAAVLGPGRPVAVLRELTKLFEERVGGTLGELAATYEAAGAPKGEVVIVVGPPEPGQAMAAEDDAAAGLDAALRQAMARSRLKQAVAEVAAATGLKRNLVYARALQLKDGGG